MENLSNIFSIDFAQLNTHLIKTIDLQQPTLNSNPMFIKTEQLATLISIKSACKKNRNTTSISFEHFR